MVLVPDGAADYPLDELDGQTPLEAAATPQMDRLAREGVGGLVQMIPPERPPGSDIGNLEIFGYDSRVHYTGRSPLEAASMGVDLGPDGIAFRMNLIYCEGDTLVDYSAGHIESAEAGELVEALAAELGRDHIRLYPGVGYRHLLVYDDGPEELVSYPPHDIMGKSVAAHLPSGVGEEKVRVLMVAAEPILANAPANVARIARGERPANAIWLWGSGRALSLETFAERYGLTGGVISAVDLVRGIGKSAGLEVVEVPGITGYLDTNYEGKAEYALAILERTDFVYVHVEAPDEAGHNGDTQAKVQAIEDFDARVVAPILKGLENLGKCRVLMTPDHRTPIALRTHSREPVPFVLWGTGVEPDGLQAYGERPAEAGSMQVDHGHLLMEYLIGKSELPRKLR
jgi:2,3-bisphosphoglycerate-independent phosphoglycerate mutase